MKRFLLTLLACGFAVGTSAEEGTASLQFPNTDVRDVLDFYARAVKKPIYLSPQVSGGVTIEWFGLTKDLPEVLRKTLLEKYGIAIRETKDGELLAEYSKDPKYPRRPEPPRPPAERKDGPVVVPRPAPKGPPPAPQ